MNATLKEEIDRENDLRLQRNFMSLHLMGCSETASYDIQTQADRRNIALLAYEFAPNHSDYEYMTRDDFSFRGRLGEILELAIKPDACEVGRIMIKILEENRREVTKRIFFDWTELDLTLSELNDYIAEYKDEA